MSIHCYYGCKKKPAPVGRWFIPFLSHYIPIYSHYLQCFKAINNYPRSMQDFVTIHSMLLHGPTNFRSSDLDPPVGEHPSQRMLCKLGDGIRGWFAMFFCVHLVGSSHINSVVAICQCNPTWPLFSGDDANQSQFSSSARLPVVNGGYFCMKVPLRSGETMLNTFSKGPLALGICWKYRGPGLH